MPVSPECIAAVRAASGDTLTADEATDLIRRMEARRAALEAAGNIDNLDARLRAAAAEDASQAQIAARIAQRQAALAAIVFDSALRHIETVRAGAGISRRKALLAYAEGTTRLADEGRNSIAATALAYRARYMETFNLAMVRDKEAARLVQSGNREFSQAVVREMRELGEGGQPGITGNPSAQRLARVYGEIATDMIRTDLNRLGATIGKLEGWSPQSHDPARVVKASFEEWRDFITPRLDARRTFQDMPAEAAEAMLRDIHKEISTGVSRQASAAELGQRTGPANLANLLSHSRTLHFRDADAWSQYAERFGTPDIHAAMASHINHAARMAAQMEKLGPNPTAMWDRLRATLQRQAASDPALTPAERQQQARTLDPASKQNGLTSAWAEFSGVTSSPGDIRFAQIGAAFRAWQSLAKLGGAVVSSVSDLSTRLSALTYQGMPLGRAITESVAETLRGRGAGEMREIAAVLDAGLDGIKNHVAAAGLAEDMPMGRLHRITNAMFCWQGMMWWQDASKAGAARMAARWMGYHAETAWDDLPARYTNVLRQHGIGATEWNAVRGLARVAEDGNRYVTPDLVRNLPRGTLASLARTELEEMQAGGASRAAARARATEQEAGWVTRRTERLNAQLQSGLAALQRVNRLSEGAADRRVEALQGRMTMLRTRLSELAEFHQALADGRAWDSAAPEPDRPFTPRAERYLDAGSAEIRAARAEGELRARLDALRRATGQVKRELAQMETKRLQTLLSWWNERENDLAAFTRRVEDRATARQSATTAEEADWQRRVDRVLDAKRDALEIQLRRFFADEMGFAYLETDAASRRLTTLGHSPGTVTGEAVRILLQFKGYPIAFTQRVLGRAMLGYSPEERALQARNLGILIAGTAVTGALAMTMKDMLRGYGPRDWSKPKTWLAALQQGGGAGIYGDFLFAQASRFGNTPLETMAGPGVSTAANVVDLFMKARDGDGKAGRALNVALQNTPFINLWYARPALDLLILNSMREAVSPGFMQRQRRQRFQDFGQQPLGSSFSAFQ